MLRVLTRTCGPARPLTTVLRACSSTATTPASTPANEDVSSSPCLCEIFDGLRGTTKKLFTNSHNPILFYFFWGDDIHLCTHSLQYKTRSRMPKNVRKIKINSKNPYWMVPKNSQWYNLTKNEDGSMGDADVTKVPDYKTHFANVMSPSLSSFSFPLFVL
jgi:hypothetical protein